MTQATVKSLLPMFVSSLGEKGRSPATVLAYRSDLDQLLAFLTKNNIVSPDQIKSKDLDVFRDTLLSQKFTPKSCSTPAPFPDNHFIRNFKAQRFSFYVPLHLLHPSSLAGNS